MRALWLASAALAAIASLHACDSFEEAQAPPAGGPDAAAGGDGLAPPDGAAVDGPPPPNTVACDGGAPGAFGSTFDDATELGRFTLKAPGNSVVWTEAGATTPGSVESTLLLADGGEAQFSRSFSEVATYARLSFAMRVMAAGPDNATTALGCGLQLTLEPDAGGERFLIINTLVQNGGLAVDVSTTSSDSRPPQPAGLVTDAWVPVVLELSDITSSAARATARVGMQDVTFGPPIEIEAPPKAIRLKCGIDRGTTSGVKVLVDDIALTYCTR